MMLRILKYYACVRVLLCSVTLCNTSFVVTLTGVNYNDCQLLRLRRLSITVSITSINKQSHIVCCESVVQQHEPLQLVAARGIR